MRYLLLFLALSPLVAQAQDLAAGLKLGLNVSRFYNTEGFEERNSKVGANVGAFLDVGFNEQLGLLTGMEYSQKGEREQNKIAGVDIVESIHLSYLDIPVFLRYKPTDRLSLYTGPQFGFLLAARYKERFDGDEVTDVDVKDQFESTDIAWGLGLTVPIVDRLWFDFRVLLGLTDILERNGPPPFNANREAHNQVFQFNLMIPLTN